MGLKKRIIMAAVAAMVLSILCTVVIFGVLPIEKPTYEQYGQTPSFIPDILDAEQVTAEPTNTPAPTPTPVSQADYNAEVQRIFSQAIQKIEQTRNVTVPQVNLQVVTKEWSIQTWGVPIANAGQTGIKREENIYKALLMIPQNASLYQATVDWAGYYMAVTQAGTIYVVKENFNVTKTVDAQATLVHELTHILQNFRNIPQHYHNFDADKARTALTEGDASFTASYIKNYTLTTNKPTPQPRLSMPSLNSNGAFSPSIPQSVYNLNYFPYTYGEQFIETLYDEGGWTTVNQAYKNPPNSTEQILHIEKYFSGELPQSVPDTIPSDGNWKKTWGAQFGEFFILNMLSTNLTQVEAEKAAAGWAGDRLAYYEGSDNQYLITWRIEWDSNGDAGEFYVAFITYMRNSGAEETQFSQWQTNKIHQKFNWNQNANSTLFIASTDMEALEQFK